MIQRWIDKKQYICFSIDELFSWQDRLDGLENDKSEAWELFDDFLNEAESHLEYSEEFIGENKKKTFYVENPAPDGNPLLFLSFGMNKVVINSGIMEFDEKQLLLENHVL